ncbi:hypothetical protein [Pseudoalteromonas sp. T1lg75]|uniref:hypothetical protein n=1 Tax=Pseudoalteromonas sp. T1lg75 TaxID=2077102 RepID=UPI000CF60F9C|nr:hypothetical protein [Pseudoalteromonas sp. T1lg75]
MELSQGAVLSLPLFVLNDSLYARDMNEPDLLLEVTLDEELLAHLCQNPSAEQSVSLQLSTYELRPRAQPLLSCEHQAMLILSRGPLLAAVLECSDGQSYVSPQLEMMPTFDLGDDDE